MTELAVAFVFRNHQVLLIYHRKWKVWMPPGGHAETGETPLQAVRRELKEEVNLEPSLNPEPFRILDGEYGTMHYFIGHIDDIASLTAQEAEIEEHRWFSRADLDTVQLTDMIRKLTLEAFDRS